MKSLMTAALAMTLASSAFAGNSDRYHDNKFDSAVGHVTQNATAATTSSAVKVTVSTRNKKSGRYADANPYGVGPNNDSR